MKKISFYFIGTFLLFQLIQVDRDNPSYDKTKEIEAPKEVMKILKKSCYDCHSFKTKWPLYSYVAPISWYVSANVHDGRKALNFSIYKDIPKDIKKARLKRFQKVIALNLMPKSDYTLIHKNAILSKKEKEILINWAKKSINQ